MPAGGEPARPAPSPRAAGPRAASPRAASPVPDDIETRDPGLARERTQMAWTRTAISFAATGAAILKNHLIAGLIVLGLGVVTWGLRLALPRVVTDEARPQRLLLVTITVTAVAIVALMVAFTARSRGLR
jgi:uncharacterized membrane protein YidH (DUF202 family)